MSESSSRRTALWIVGGVIFVFAVAAVLATVLFPVVAGFMRVNMPSAPGFRAVLAWWRFVIDEGRYGAFWSNLWSALSVGDRRAFITPLGKALVVTSSLSIVGGCGLFVFGLVARMGNLNRIQPGIKRVLLRGGVVLRWTALPSSIAALIVKDLAQTPGERRKTKKTLLALKPDRAAIAAIRADAEKLNWRFTKADLHANARCAAMGDWAAQRGMVRIGPMPMPRDLESSHLLICASTGAGKTLALKQLLGNLRQRGDRVIVLDAGYDLSSAYRRSGDLLLSSVDPDSEGWDLRNEVRQPSEWARMAASLIPASGGGDAAEWKKKAQTFFTNVCIQVGEAADNKKLLEILSVWPADALRELLKGTPSGTLLEEGGERYLNSVKANITESISGWQFGKSGPFSLRAYMISDDPRWLWLPYRDPDKAAVAATIATWIDILVLAGLERAERPDKRKTWFIIDELDSIGAINSLKEAVTRLRKSDVAIVAAIQDYSQLVERYGRETAQTLFGCFSNRLYLRCNSEELARKISKELGEAEYEETRVSTSETSRQRVDMRGGPNKNVSVSASRVKAELVMASQIQKLPTRMGYVSLSGDSTVYPIIVPIPEYERRS